MSATGTGTGLLGAVLGTALLFLALHRVRVRSAEIAFGEEFGQFVGYVAAIGLVWWVMGMVALVPFVGPYLGWDWIPGFLSRLTPSDVLGTIAGLLLSWACVGCLTPLLYTQSYSRIFIRWRGFAFPYTPSGRWTIALACFYLSAVSLDLLRVLFAAEPATRLTFGAIGTALAYLSVIAGAPLIERWLLRRVSGHASRFSLVSLVSVLVLSGLIGDLLRNGSVHLGPIVYAFFFRRIAGSAPGLLALLACVLLAGILLRRQWPGWIRRMPGAVTLKTGPAPVPPAATPLSAAQPHPTPRWRRFDKATGKRVEWP
jgi:hypothetical protein